MIVSLLPGTLSSAEIWRGYECAQLTVSHEPATAERCAGIAAIESGSTCWRAAQADDDAYVKILWSAG